MEAAERQALERLARADRALVVARIECHHIIGRLRHAVQREMADKRGSSIGDLLDPCAELAVTLDDIEGDVGHIFMEALRGGPEADPLDPEDDTTPEPEPAPKPEPAGTWWQAQTGDADLADAGWTDDQDMASGGRPPEAQSAPYEPVRSPTASQGPSAPAPEPSSGAPAFGETSLDNPGPTTAHFGGSTFGESLLSEPQPRTAEPLPWEATTAEPAPVEPAPVEPAPGTPAGGDDTAQHEERPHEELPHEWAPTGTAVEEETVVTAVAGQPDTDDGNELPETAKGARSASPPTSIGAILVTLKTRLVIGRQQWPNVGIWVRRTGLVILAFCAYQAWGTSVWANRSQDALRQEFQTKVAISDPLVPGAAPADPVGAASQRGDPVALMEIPRLDVTRIVVEGTGAAELRAGPGHQVGSSPPGTAGNVVVAGHRVAYGDPFRNIDTLRAGDTITMTTPTNQVEYYVSEQPRTISAGDRAPLSDSGDDRLTLVTSDPPYQSANWLIVVAQPVDPLPASTESDARGNQPIGSPRSSLLPVLLWAGVMVAIGFSYVRFQPQWPRHTVLVAAGLAVIALIGLFESVGGLLSPTL